MADEKTTNTSLLPTPPTWVYLVALALGIPLAGGGGSVVGSRTQQQAAAADIVRLEAKFDKLDEKLDALAIAIAANHGGTP